MNEQEVIVDKNVDDELLKIVSASETKTRGRRSLSMDRKAIFAELQNQQQAELNFLAESMPKMTMFRRVVKVLLPLVEESQRVRS